jgi:hypothetical protein
METDRRTDVTQLTRAFRGYVKAPNVRNVNSLRHICEAFSELNQKRSWHAFTHPRDRTENNLLLKLLTSAHTASCRNLAVYI